jgi:hypothetical protein
VPVISANFARCRVVTQMLNGWNSLFQSKKYIGSNFLTLYQRKDTPLIPTHVKSGPWMCKVGHSHSLTAHLVHCTTGHAPIGAFCSRFFPEDSTACRCSFPMETVSHVLYRCPSHEWESEPKEQLRYMWLLKSLEANESAFASASGMRGTSMTIDLQPVLLRWMTPSCKQSRMASVRPTMLVWRMYVKYMSSLTL